MKPVNFLFVLAGFVFVGLGTAGIFLPILPTVKFYLLAVVCFAKGSMRFHRWFTGTKLYKNNLESFVQNRSMTLKAKLKILVPVSAMIILIAIMVDVLAMRIAIGVLILAKWWYFMFAVKTIKENKE